MIGFFLVTGNGISIEPSCVAPFRVLIAVEQHWQLSLMLLHPKPQRGDKS